MKNSLQKGTISLLIMKTGDKYLGICKEFGFVEEGPTSEAVEKRLVNSAVLLLETVIKNPRLEPSLSAKPPFKYLCLFYFAPFILAFNSLVKNFHGDMRLFERNLNILAHV
jgi:hypothetical protein